MESAMSHLEDTSFCDKQTHFGPNKILPLEIKNDNYLDNYKYKNINNVNTYNHRGNNNGLIKMLEKGKTLFKEN